MKPKNYFFFLLLAAFAILFYGPGLQAATITPNIFTDPRIVPLDQPGDCSLRYAIQAINTGGPFAGCANTTPAEGFGMNDTIILQAGPYVLTIMGNSGDNTTGDLDVIMKDINIVGPGSGQTSIDASGISGGDRVLELDTVNNASITGVTFKGGDVSGIPEDGGGILSLTKFLALQDVQIIGNKAGQGGGISVACDSTITDSLIQGNEAVTTPGSGNGGGIFIFLDAFCSPNPIVSVNNSQILGNTAGGGGGGIAGATFVSLTVDNSTIDGNNALSCGGLIALFVGITNSTISRNHATAQSGGGICSGEYLFLTNTTVSTNTAVTSGGGIASTGGLKGSYNVTIAFNEAGSTGGGVLHNNAAHLDTRFPMVFFDTIIAKNTAPTDPDCSGDMGTTGGFNLIGDIGTSCTGFTDMVAGDQVGSPGSAIDPLLLPLDFYGGSTETHALDRNSRAVDMGNDIDDCEALDQDLFLSTRDNTLVPPAFFNTGTRLFLDLTDDQRFFLRPIAILDPNVPICDIGAFELQTFSFDLTKDDGLSGASVEVGESFTYTMILTNNGPGDATDVILNDPLPAQVDFVSFTTSQGDCTAVNDVVNCTLGDMLHGQSATVTVTVLAVATGDAVNTATVTTSVGDFSDTVTTPIIAPPGVILTQGDNLFNCTLSHGGPAKVRGLAVVLLLSLAAGLAYGQLRRRPRRM